MAPHQVIMPSSPLSGLSYSLLTPLSLRAFNPCPETGTLFGPLTAADPAHPERVSRLISDRDTAEDLELCSLLMGTEASDLASVCRRRGQRAPYLIPAEAGKPASGPASGKETRWFLNEEDIGPAAGQVRKLCFSSESPSRRVFMDFSDAARSLYEFRMESQPADLSQSIAVGTKDYDVSTDRFTFRIQAKNFRNAAALAWQLSTIVYTCGQYNTEELGDLLFRRLEDAAWTRVTAKDGKRFTPPRLFPEGGVPFSLVSRATVAGTGAEKPRPVFNIDILPAEDSLWNVGVIFRRPSMRDRKLMPLHPKLIRGLWEPSFQKILKRSEP